MFTQIKNTLYITDEKAFISYENDNIVISSGEQKTKIPLNVLSNIVSFSFGGATVPVMYEVDKHGVGLMFIDPISGDFVSINGELHGNVLLRKKQYDMLQQSDSILIANNMISAKIANSASVLKRCRHNGSESNAIDMAIDNASVFIDSAVGNERADTLLGIEGSYAKQYFDAFADCIKAPEMGERFSGRVKRPPTDPVNALLSLLYTLVAQDCKNALYAAGLDPYLGVLHTERPGRPSLALDLQEEFRPVVDRFVLKVINKRQLTDKDFETQIGGAVFLKKKGKQELFRLWQEEKRVKIKHPVFHKQMEQGVIPYAQAMILAQTIRGDRQAYLPYLIGSTR